MLPEIEELVVNSRDRTRADAVHPPDRGPSDVIVEQPACLVEVPGSSFPVFDKTLPTIVAFPDSTLWRTSKVLAHVLTDNETTVTRDHAAKITVRNKQIVADSRLRTPPVVR